MTRRLGAFLALLGILLAAGMMGTTAAYAAPTLRIGEVRAAPGQVEFNLTVQSLAPGEQPDLTSVAVAADDTPLAVTAAVPTATIGDAETAGRRLAVLVIDVSDSMFGQPLTEAMAAATRYVDDLPEDIEIAVVTVGTTAQTRLPPTTDRAAARQLLSGLFTEGATALYDGLAAAAELVADTGTYPESRILVLSDGADSSSVTAFADIERRLAQMEAPVDTVAFRTEQTVADLLAGLSSDTGGRAYLADDAGDLAGAFRSAAEAFGLRLRITAEVPAALSGRQTTLRISLRVAEQTVRTAVPARLAVDPDAVLPLMTVPAATPSRLAEWGPFALMFAGLLALGLVTFSPLLDRSRRRRLLAQVDQFAIAPAAPPAVLAEPDANSPVARAALALSERVVQSRGLESRIATQLDRAGMRLRPHEWLLLRGLICVTAAILLALFVNPLGAIVLGLGGGWVATELYQRYKAGKRQETFATLLPDALQLVIGSLRSGFSLSQAVDAMVRELPDPISSEFGRALGEARLGQPLEDALDRVAVRMNNVDLRWAVVAIRVQQQVGGNLAEVLTTTVHTMRERESLRRHVRALSAEGRLSAWILVALPILAGLFIFIARTEYAMVLLTDPLGLLMLLVGLVLVVLGALWMVRVVKVEI